MRWMTRAYQAWERSEPPIVLSVFLVSVGVVAVILGDGASKSFADLGGSVVIRIMGVILIIGGCLVISSIVNSDALREVLGLALTALGTAIFSGGAILGLGTQGLVSGIGYAGITLTLLSRILFLLTSARAHSKLDNIE
jgi:hypothetical protein